MNILKILKYQNWSLTTGLDTLTGSSADDVFTAAPGTSAVTGNPTTTITSGDKIVGSAGNDTLNITATAANNNSLTGLTVKGVEVVNVAGANNLGGNAAAVAEAATAVVTAKAAEAVAVQSQALADVKSAAATSLYIELIAGSSTVETKVGVIVNNPTYGGLYKQYVIHDYLAQSSLSASTYAGIVEINALTTLPTGVNAFSLSELKSVANAALRNLDGTTSTSGADDATISARYIDIFTSTVEAFEYLGLSTTDELADLTALGNANFSVASLLGNAGIEADVLTLAGKVTTPAESASQAAAFAALVTNSVNTKTEVDAVAASSTAIAAGLGYDLSDYKAAAALLLKDASGDALVATDSVTGITESSVIELDDLLPGQSVTINGLSVFSTAQTSAADLAVTFATGAGAGANAANIVVSGTWNAAKFALPTIVPEVFTADFSASGAIAGADTIVFDGNTTTLAGAETPTAIATAVAGGTFLNWDAEDNGDGTVTFTEKTGATNPTDITAADFTITDTGATGTLPVVTVNVDSQAGADGKITAASAVAGPVTDIVITGIAGYEVADVTTTDGVLAVVGSAVDTQIAARLTALSAAATAVNSAVGSDYAAGLYTSEHLAQAIDSALTNIFTGEALDPTVAADVVEMTRLVINAGNANSGASSATGDFSYAQLVEAASKATVGTNGLTLLTSVDDSAAILTQSSANASGAATIAVTALAATTAAALASALAENTSTVLSANATNGTVNAAQFVGSDEIWLSGASNVVDVVGATTQTIGLRALSGMDNSIAFGAAAGSVYVEGSTGDLAITGAKALSIAGTTGTLTLSASSTSLDLDMSGANTMTLTDAAALESITISGAGTTTLKGVSDTVESIVSTEAAVTATISTETVVDLKATDVDETVDATVSTAGGADVITVATTGTGSTSVSTGGGSDVIVIGSRGLNARDTIDAGAGTDTIVFAGKTYTAQDYVVLDSAVSGVEVALYYSPVVADASKLGIPVLAMERGGVLTEASTSSMITWGSLTASSTGYEETDGVDDTVYGGNLSVTLTGGTSISTAKLTGSSSALSLNAKAATVTIAATSLGSITGTSIAGDLESLVVNMANSKTKTGDSLAATTITVTATENQALTSVDLNGTGSVTIDTSAAAEDDIVLATIDASGLGGVTLYSNGKVSTTVGSVTGGLDFTGNSFIAETITLGYGTDTVTVNSTYENMDTIIGADFVKETSTAKSTSDTIEFGGLILDGSAEDEITELELTSGATSLGKAFVEAAASGTDPVFFAFDGDTYLYQNTGTAALEDGDLAVKIAGVVDLSTDWGVYQG